MNFIREFFEEKLDPRTGVKRIYRIRETADGTQHARLEEILPKVVTKTSKIAKTPDRYMTEESLKNQIGSVKDKLARASLDNDRLKKKNAKLKS